MGRQVSRNLGSLVWREGGSTVDKFPATSGPLVWGAGSRQEKSIVDKFPATSGLLIGGGGAEEGTGRQVSRNLGSLVWRGGARKRKTHSTSFPQPRVFSLEADGTDDKFPATSGL